MDPLLFIFRAAVLALAGYLWWHARRLASRNAQLEAEVEAQDAEVAAARRELDAARGQIVEGRKLASLGQLTAGVAHEIKNPLNFVNNFARLSVDLARDLRGALEADPQRPAAAVLAEAGDLLDDITHNAEKIEEHGRRADSIVRDMLLHARSDASGRQPVDLNALLAEYAGLAYHGRRAADPRFNVTFDRDLDPEVGEVAVVPQDIGRVAINLVNNAFDAVTERAAEAGDGYEPTVGITTQAMGDSVEMRVADNGTGIPEDVRARVFDPFFTTKPAGAGTGLGLSLSYEIVTHHGGTMVMETAEGEGTTFIITLPKAGPDGGDARDE